MNSWKWFSRALLAGLITVLSLVTIFPARPALAQGMDPGAVYTQTNAASGNEVLVFSRAADGSLAPGGAYATGGLGTGAGLGSQGAVVLSQDGQWLLAVNAGSNDISVFAITADGLERTDIEPSGGMRPISVTLYKGWVYVLNAGGSGNITGFWLGHGGDLEPIPGSTRPLSNGGQGAAPGPAQIAFAPDGESLVVTEKASNNIDTYAVGADGLAGDPVVHASAGITPFGFAFNRYGVLVVSEAFGGAPNISAASSYLVRSGGFVLVSPSVPTGQTAACWVAISNDGHYAYTTNAGSGSVSAYSIGQDGTLELLEARAGDTGAGSSPIDAAFSHDGRYLYVLGSGSDQVHAFRLQADGSLEALGSVSAPDGAAGLAAW